MPKYIGPYRILKDFGNSSFCVELPANLKSRGLHDVFHASLLRIHSPNDDCLFPGQLDSQVEYLGGTEGEWLIDRIRTHAGQGSGALFEILWKSGDVTWLPYEQIAKSAALEDYLEAQGVRGIKGLPKGLGQPMRDVNLAITVIGWELEKVLADYKTDEERGTHHTRRMMKETENWFLKHRGSQFILLDPRGNAPDRPLSVSHVRDILEFDRLLRGYTHVGRRWPTDYDKIASWFNESPCNEKLARLDKKHTVLVFGPSPYFDTSGTPAPQPYYSTVPNTDERISKKEQELTRILKLGLEADRRASASSSGRKGSTTRQDRLGRRFSLRGAMELATYSTPGSSSSSRRVSRAEPLTDHVISPTFDPKDTVMQSDSGAAEEDVFDPDTVELAEEANAEETVEFE